MSLLKVSDNYSAFIVGNFSTTAETITVDIAPVKTAGYLTVFDLNGNQLEKIKYTGVDGLNLTGCVRGLSFDNNSDTPVVGNAKDLKNGMAIKMTVTQHYINPLVDVINGTNAFEGVPKNPSTRTISDNRHLTDKEYVDGIAAGGILSMLVSIDSGLNININPGNYILNGTVETYAGAASEPLTDDDTNYIQLVDGALDINTTGFSDDAIPLATAICASGEITSLTDSRPFYTGTDLKENGGLGRDANGQFVKIGAGLSIDVDGNIASDYKPEYIGSGADGALNITTGTTTIDLGGAAVFDKNYTSISITGDGNLAFSNPNAKGTIIRFYVVGDVTITSTSAVAIDLRNLGSTGGAAESAANDGVGTILINQGGGAGSRATGTRERLGAIPNQYSPLTFQTITMNVGTGGGGSNGAGGRGAGSLLIVCGGNYTFENGTINASGTDGNTALTGGSGGGGGGSLIVMAGDVLANTGTFLATGGKGGDINALRFGGAGGTWSTNKLSYGGSGGTRNSASEKNGGGGGAGVGGNPGADGDNNGGSGQGGCGGGGGGGTYIVRQLLKD